MDGTVKVGDFGLVTALAENVEENNPSSTFTTSTKHTADVGTQLYMSPEQVFRIIYTFNLMWGGGSHLSVLKEDHEHKETSSGLIQLSLFRSS